MSDKYDQDWALLFAPKENIRWAVTIGQTTYYSCEQEKVEPSWRIHEECHKLQWRRDGAFKFIMKYLWYQLRYGYAKNPYEVEANSWSLTVLSIGDTESTVTTVAEGGANEGN